MFTNRTAMAIFATTITFALSLTIVSGFIGSGFAFTKSNNIDRTIKFGGSDNSSLPAVLANGLGRPHSAAVGSPSDNTGNISLDIPAKEFLKTLSQCESKAAANGGLTQAEVEDCFHQTKAKYSS